MKTIIKKCVLGALFVAMGAWTPAARAGFFTVGDLVVVRIGDGTAPLTSASTSTFLDEYTTATSQTNPVASLNVTTGGVNPLTNSGTATSEGALSLSGNGQYLALAGYSTAAGATTSVASSTVNRDVALVDANGNVNTSTVFTSAFSGNNIRGAATMDGTQVYAVGALGGVQYATTGSTVTSATANQISSTVANERTVQVINGQLYMSTGSGTTRGVYEVASGTITPANGLQTASSIAQDSSPTAGSPYAFTVLGNNLYLADSNALASGGGLQKFVYNSSTSSYTYEYTITAGLSNTAVGITGLTGVDVNGTNTLYATSSDGIQLLGVTDAASATSNPGDSFSVLATAGTNEAFRGLAFAPSAAPAVVPEPSSWIMLALGVPGARWVLRRRETPAVA